MGAAIACRGLTKRFGDVVAVNDVSLEAATGEIVAVLGPSGCGKTTLLRLIAGFERPESGSVELAGVVVAGDGVRVPPERRRVGFVFQDYALFPHLDVDANVAYGLSRGERAARVEEVLTLVGLPGYGPRAPGALSGGEQQRVALARALAPRPRAVLLDEPFSNLDADLRQRVRDDVRRILREAGTTAIFVTHDQDEAFDIADRILVMRGGRIEQAGDAWEVYHTPSTRFVADFVGEAAFLAARVDDGVVRTDLGSFALGDEDPGPGDVEIMIRPEDVRIAPDDAAGAAVQAGGEVLARRFRGPVALTTVRLPSGVVLAAAHSSQERFAIGARVSVGFDPDHIVLFRGERRVARAAQERTAGD